MKRIVSRLIVVLTIIALVFGTLPADRAEAAKKKSKTSITVSTQEELVKALKSGRYKKITIKTDAKISFTLAAKYSNGDLKIVVNAKNATFNSKGTVGSIVVNEAKTVKEYASGNNITVNDENLTIKTMEGASVETLKIASETGEVKLVNNGEIGRVDVTGESRVAVEQNGSVGRLYVAAAAEIGVTGTSEEKLAVTVKPEAAGAAVKSELPVKVNAYADVDLQLEKGAENSAVTLKNEDAGVKLENNTDKKVTVTDSDGEKQTVKKGEDLTSDNYVGKPEETDDGTEGETSGTPSDGTEVDKKEDEDKEEEKKEDKEEEKKDDTTTETVVNGGDSSGGGSYIPPTAEKILIDALEAAGKNAKPNSAPEVVNLTTDVTLTDNITIPVNVVLNVGTGERKAVLNADTYKINIQETGTIYVHPGSKLIAAEKAIQLVPTEASAGKEADGGIEILAGGEVKVGAYSFTITEGDAARLHWLRKYDLKHVDNNDDADGNADGNADEEFFLEIYLVEIQNLGGELQITGDAEHGYDKLPGALVEYFITLPFEQGYYDHLWKQLGKGQVLYALSIMHIPDVRYEKFVTKVDDRTVLNKRIVDSDWINAYFDPERAKEIADAEEKRIFPSCMIERSESGKVITIPADSGNGAAIETIGELCIPAGYTLVTKNTLNMEEYSSILRVKGTFESQYSSSNTGIGVSSSVFGAGNAENKDPHIIVETFGPNAKLIMDNMEITVPGIKEDESGVMFSAEYDERRTGSKTYIRLQVPDGTEFKVASTGEYATVDQVNAWLTRNNISFDIICYDDTVRENGTEHITISENTAWLVERGADGEENNSIKQVTLPTLDGDGYYNVTLMDELLAVYVLKGDGSDPDNRIKIKLNPTSGTDASSDANCFDYKANLKTMWDIEVAPGKTIYITPGSSLEAAVTVASGAAIHVQVFENESVKEYGELRTCKNGNITVKTGGKLILHNGKGDSYDNYCAKSILRSGKGGKVIVEDGAYLGIYGAFVCCYDSQIEPLFIVADRENVTGNGVISLVPDVGVGYDLNEGDLWTRVKNMISSGSTQTEMLVTGPGTEFSSTYPND